MCPGRNPRKNKKIKRGGKTHEKTKKGKKQNRRIVQLADGRKTNTANGSFICLNRVRIYYVIIVPQSRKRRELPQHRGDSDTATVTPRIVVVGARTRACMSVCLRV